jgi:hypothetical protein
MPSIDVETIIQQSPPLTAIFNGILVDCDMETIRHLHAMLFRRASMNLCAAALMRTVLMRSIVVESGWPGAAFLEPFSQKSPNSSNIGLFKYIKT